LIGFWILFVLCGISVFAWALFVWHASVVMSFVAGIVTVLVLRGFASYFKRYLVLHDRIAEETDGETRTTETNRYTFWRWMLRLGIVVGIYIGVLSFTGVGAFDALFAIPGLIGQALPMVFQILILIMANFMLFLGPFFLYGMMGRQVVMPGDANYDVKIDDVRGQKSAVNEMVRILRLIEQGRNYVKAGGKRERGVLMVGPPGTGKTMLAKGIASSLRMPIIITTGSSFAGMFMGMDVLNVITMMRAAKSRARRWGGCAIFIDEIDALGNRRSGMAGGMPGGMGGMMGGGGGMALNTLLVQMDGVDQPGFIKRGMRRLVNVCLDGLFLPREVRLNSFRIPMRIPPLAAPRYNILFMGATNRASVLDEALTRPGRFGRTITFRMPTREDRKDIAELYFQKKKHDSSLDTPERRDEFSRISEGYSPAMIDQALSLALMYAFEEGRDAFIWKDLREAMGNIESGLVQPVEYTEREQVAVARHELGHAVAQRFFQPDHQPVRLSIKMRADGSLGRLSSQKVEEEFSRFRSQMAGRLRTILGAIAAERVFYGENSEGVFGDLMMATSLAAHMVGLVGMGPDQLSEEESRRAMQFGDHLISIAEVTQGATETGTSAGATIANPRARAVVAQVIGSAYVDCWRLMYVNKEAIDLAAEALIAQGEIVGNEISGLLESVGLRHYETGDPYPPALPVMPRLDAAPVETEKERRRTA